jgi:hypothetical protein
MSGEVQFRAVKVGDLSKVAPDLPRGEWTAVCKVKKAATSADQFPMLILEWKTVEALTDGNENFVGKSVTDFVTFFPEDHKAYKMGQIKLRSICEAYEIAIPAVNEIESWDDIGDFVGELEGLKGKIYTAVEQRKDTGEMQTRVLYTAPKASFSGVKEAADDEDEAPAKKPAKKSSKRN